MAVSDGNYSDNGGTLANVLDNDFSEFKRPDHYIRHIGTFWVVRNLAWTRVLIRSEPIESELAVQVEYDMDEQGTSRNTESTASSSRADVARQGMVRRSERREEEGTSRSSLLRDVRDHHGQARKRVVQPRKSALGCESCVTG